VPAEMDATAEPDAPGDGEETEEAGEPDGEAPAECGNSLVEPGEECDDGKDGDPDDGCRNDCRWSCHDNGECGARPCAEAGACDTGRTHRCVYTPRGTDAQCRASAFPAPSHRREV